VGAGEGGEVRLGQAQLAGEDLVVVLAEQG
jgi:hypothetical protein